MLWIPVLRQIRDQAIRSSQRAKVIYKLLRLRKNNNFVFFKTIFPVDNAIYCRINSISREAV